MTKTPRLITIPFSHYCDKARWALDHAGVAFEESAYLPLLHAGPSLLAGGKRSVPVLVTSEGTLPDSTDILRWADARAPKGRGLFGDTAAEGREIADLEDLFDIKLGPDTRRWIYHYILPHRDLILKLTRDDRVPSWQNAALSVGFPVARAVMKKAMNITPAGAERSEARVDAAFDRVGDMLKDGRPFLVGSRFSAADLTFAALSGPILLPPEYGAALPPIDDLPREAVAKIRGWQAHPAGQFALKLYREHRRSNSN